MSSCIPESFTEKFESVKEFASAAYTKCVPNFMQEAHSNVKKMSRNDLTSLALKVVGAAIAACLIASIAGTGGGIAIAIGAVVAIGVFYYCGRPEAKSVDTEEMASGVKRHSKKHKKHSHKKGVEKEKPVKNDGQPKIDQYFSKVSVQKEKVEEKNNGAIEKSDKQQKLEKYFQKLEVKADKKEVETIEIKV
ncbi:MAG: hypothetical protein H0T62_01570 [Parachlamydiaceae bacterium]|nr:hypothetical protein [Parachlamydiaceae bacterium]